MFEGVAAPGRCHGGEGVGSMKRAIMIGVWIMIAAALSTIVTVPLGFGTVSGVVFAIGMIFAWFAGIWALVLWGAHFYRSKRKSR